MQESSRHAARDPRATLRRQQQQQQQQTRRLRCQYLYFCTWRQLRCQYLYFCTSSRSRRGGLAGAAAISALALLLDTGANVLLYTGTNAYHHTLSSSTYAYTLTYAHVCSRMLTYAGDPHHPTLNPLSSSIRPTACRMPRPLLTYAYTLTYAHVCSRMQKTHCAPHAATPRSSSLSSYISYADLY